MYEKVLSCTAPNKPQCSDGAVRLVGGRIEQEGRVEVCMEEMWGSTCRSEFTVADLYVVCSHFGYHGKGVSKVKHFVIICLLFIGHTFLSNNALGSGEGPIFRGFDCQGWEQNMAECFNSSEQYQTRNNLYCNSYSTTAVRCSDCESTL